MAVSTHTMMIMLSDDERDLLQAFASEQGIADPANAVGQLLREYARAIDMIWELKLSQNNGALDDLLKQVRADSAAGLTDTLTPDLLDDEF
ncbi:MAG: hypothetical protein L6Q98_16130 [Anaerolineae bacterium]|nr:hypothetical protein [Anaerolineae bacterium]NUQ04720.1 hypothetical protein [Anaerolineae bacterium]